jgi:hypothetical protein
VTQPSAPLASNYARSDDEVERGAARAEPQHNRWLRRAASNEWVGGAGVALVLILMGHFYLWPASSMMWTADRTHLMSNGGDATTLPFIYDLIQRAAHESPRNLMYGTIHNPRLGPPNGSGMWVPWIERWIVAALHGTLPLAATPTAFVWLLMVGAGLSFYAFARAEQWPRLLALSFALAYAFNPYTRARAVVHAALVGIYCLPLVFLALRLIKRDPRPVRLLLAASLFIFSLWTAHYYILMLVASAPLFVWFQLRQDEPETPAARIPRLASRSLDLVLAVAPAAVFLAWNFLHPLAPGAPPTQPAVPSHEVAQQYLRLYAASPIDYVSGDVALGPRDLNPLRQWIDDKLFAARFGGSNVWERANGIRWSILIPALALIAALCVPALRRRLRASVEPGTWHKLTYFSVCAALMFWFSLSPSSLSIYQHDLGAAAWVHALFPEFRVPSRFGPFVHFAVLALVGTYVSAHWQRAFGAAAPRWRRALPCLLPLLMVLDYPPLQPVAIDDMRTPRFDLVAAGSGKCGVGIHFPYSLGAGTADEYEMYPAYQQLRDTDCSNLQQPLATEFHARMLQTIGNPAFAAATGSPENARALRARFVAFARCAQLDWVIFRARVPEPWRQQLCAQLGWRRIAPDACASSQPRAATFLDPAPRCQATLAGR